MKKNFKLVGVTVFTILSAVLNVFQSSKITNEEWNKNNYKISQKNELIKNKNTISVVASSNKKIRTHKFTSTDSSVIGTLNQTDIDLIVVASLIIGSVLVCISAFAIKKFGPYLYKNWIKGFFENDWVNILSARTHVFNIYYKNLYL